MEYRGATDRGKWKMKILHLLIDVRSSWGGPVRSVRDLVRIQRSLGIEVCVVSLKREGTVEEFEGARVMTFPPSFPSRFGNSSGAVQWLRENARQFDLALVSEVWSLFIQRAMSVLRECGVPYVVQPRGSLDPSDLKKKQKLKQILGPLFVRKNLEAAKCILTASDAESERLETFGAKVPRRTLSHPVRPNPPGNRQRLRAEWQVPPEMPVFLYLSRIDPKKRVHLLLEAFDRAAAKLPPCRLLIAGDGNPALVATLQEQAKSMACGKEIFFLGFQGGERKSDLLAAADVFVLPSEFENFGIAVVEALHAGLPVVLSTGVQIYQGIVAAGAGLSFGDSAVDLAEILVRLGTDAGLRWTMARAAATYAPHFSPERLAPVYSAFWSSMARATPQ